MHLRHLCERYIVIDDKVKELSEKLDKETNYREKQKLTVDYLKAYMEREDFKSGMRRKLVEALVDGIGD